MADFQEVMKQWRRMCEKNRIDCMRFCPICANPTCGELAEATDEQITKAEAAIMAWAADHPEPVYPTWAEFLHEAFCEKYPMPYRGDAAWYAFLRETHIPDDIAEKLGIEPKEV